MSTRPRRTQAVQLESMPPSAFTQKFREHTATFTPRIDGDRCVWTVELCGETREFTFDNWTLFKRGQCWVADVLSRLAA